MDIKCRKTKCKYNDRFVCQIKKLHIDKRHVCVDYEKALDQPEDTTKLIFLKKVEYAPFRHCKNIDINCDAKECLFNDGGVCKANGILVNVQEENPVCLTFLLR